MNVFQLRQKLIEDYSTYIKRFIKIQDQTINKYVHTLLRSWILWLAVVWLLAAYRQSTSSETARVASVKVLSLIADTAEDEVVRPAAHSASGETNR